MADELSAPLGKKRRPRRRIGRERWRSLPYARMGAGALALIIVGLAAWVVLVDDPLGGRPTAEAPVSATPDANPLAIEIGTQEPAMPSSAPTIETTPGGPSIITLGEDVPASGLAQTALTEFGALPDLVEETAHGPIPRVGPSGVTPFEAYARPSISADAAGGRALIGIIVTGLGLNETVTTEAIDTLPGAVTLAFAPYGNRLATHAASARSAGHEIMLEVPLEPFDYPQNDPGPHTLLAEQPARDNLEKLYWLFARFGGYTGLINHMGARFTASAGDFSPLMEELGLRGLAYLDDGSSNRSVAPQLARENNVPYARADLEIDANPSRTAILSALQSLQTRAAERGSAIGTLSALPVSIRTLAEWADTLDDDSVILVPISALSTQSQQ